MGTRRSRHNKGRKPLYKEHGAESIRRWDFEEKPKREKHIPVVRNLANSKRTPAEVELEVQVAAFLAQRNAPPPDLVALHEKFGGKCQHCGIQTNLGRFGPDRATRDHHIPRSKGGGEGGNLILACAACNSTRGNRDPTELPVAWRNLGRRQQSDYHLIEGAAFRGDLKENENDIVSVSERDIVLQLFIERRLSLKQLRAARIWQRYLEEATIQPNKTIDWSAAINPLNYQRRGDLVERQKLAMAHRRLFSDSVGVATAAFLDFCLDADRGRSDLMSALRVDGAAVAAVVDDLLTKLCIHYGFNPKPVDEGSTPMRSWRGSPCFANPKNARIAKHRNSTGSAAGAFAAQIPDAAAISARPRAPLFTLGKSRSHGTNGSSNSAAKGLAAAPSRSGSE